MPQPALHLLIAHETLTRWARTDSTPFDVGSAVSRNAFLIGALAPDLGLFPGGDTRLSRRLHRERTGGFARTLLARARTDASTAFACGWLSHLLADVAIHPLVNRAAAGHAGTSSPTLIDHVRVEVGLDAWLAWQHPALRHMRLRPFFSRRSSAWLRAALHDTYGSTPTSAQIVQMQRGLLRFSHLALHFATRVARQVCWADGGSAAPVPLTSAVTWRVVTMLSARQSTTHAYLNPLRPAAALLEPVQQAVAAHPAELDAWLNAGLQQLPDYDLETGARVVPARSVA